MENTKKPDRDFRLGNIKASIWVNPTEYGDQYTITVSRMYRKDDKWQRAETFRPEELPLLTKVVDLAQTWIFNQTQS
jgi:hypothetical protein